MKKITLTSILIFLLITGAMFVANITSIDMDLVTDTQAIKNGDDNAIKYQETNDSPKDSVETPVKTPTKTPVKIPAKKTPKNSNSTKSKAAHLNDPNLNISQLKFNLETTSADTFTMDKVAKHGTRSDCYLVINNKVYDVSTYISHHPGGSRTITSRCGKEVSGVFARIHSNKAWDLLKEYKVGTTTTN